MIVLSGISPPIHSLRQLLLVAHAMEEEAARRYMELAARMELRGEKALASLFEFLASIEKRHAVQISSHFLPPLDQVFDLSQATWQVPENFDEEAGSSHLLTPYLALATAVRNEDRAFAFYTYVASDASDDQIRKMAEELAKEELGHAALLRKERRNAYYAEGGPKRRHTDIPASIDEFWEMAFRTERYAASYHRALGGNLADRAPESSIFLMAADDEDNRAREAADRAGVEWVAEYVGQQPTVEGGLRLLEEAFERYSDISEHADDEEVMQASIDSADHALRRLSLTLGALSRETH